MLIVSAFHAASVQGATCYVSSSAGSDDNSGTGAGSAWRTFTMASGVPFTPGDTLLENARDRRGRSRPDRE